jgi:DNA-binding IclR family transcriptional regulator
MKLGKNQNTILDYLTTKSGTTDEICSALQMDLQIVRNILDEFINSGYLHKNINGIVSMKEKRSRISENSVENDIWGEVLQPKVETSNKLKNLSRIV